MNIKRRIKNNIISILNKIRVFCEHLGYVKRRFITPKLPKNSDGKVYVNLGCGANTSGEFINIDTRPMPHIHHIHEVEELPMIATNSVDLLHVSHLLEHVPRDKVPATLKEWYRVLKKGGVLRFGVPDFDNLIEIYKISGNDVHSIVNQLMGKDAPYDDHHTIWNFTYAKQILESTGFKKVRLLDVNKVEHYSFSDKSRSVRKIGDKEILISLNVEATK